MWDSETVHKDGGGRNGLLDFPAEIQTSIVQSLYAPGTIFPQYTALLLTNKHLHAIAYPIFTSSYPLECVPLKPGNPRANYGRGGGDILKIAWLHDDDTYHMHLLEEGWMAGLREGLGMLFDVNDATNDSALESEEDEDSENEDEDDEFDIDDMDVTLSERALQFAEWWIRNNAFAKTLRKIGRENAENLGSLKITWGGWETNRRGGCQYPGPYAVGIMSVICSLFLPNLKRVTLQQTVYNEGEREIQSSRRYGVDDEPRNGESEEEREARLWPEHLKVEIMGSEDDDKKFADQSYMVTAVRMMREACVGLKELRLEDWGGRGRSQWWRDLFERNGLKMEVECPEPEPEQW